MKTKTVTVQPVMVFDGQEYFDNYLNRYLPDIITAVAGIKNSYNTLVEEVDFPKFNKEVFLNIIQPDATHELKIALDKTLPTLPKALRHLASDVFKEEIITLDKAVAEYRKALKETDRINRKSNAPLEVLKPAIFEFDAYGNMTTSDAWKNDVRRYFNHYLSDIDEINLYHALRKSEEAFNEVVTLIKEKRFKLPTSFMALYQIQPNTDLVRLPNEQVKFRLSLRL